MRPRQRRPRLKLKQMKPQLKPRRPQQQEQQEQQQLALQQLLRMLKQQHEEMCLMKRGQAKTRSKQYRCEGCYFTRNGQSGQSDEICKVTDAIYVFYSLNALNLDRCLPRSRRGGPPGSNTNFCFRSSSHRLFLRGLLN